MRRTCSRAWDRAIPPIRTSAASGNGTRLKPSTPSFGSMPAKPVTIAVPSRNGIGGQRKTISPLLTYAGRYSGRAFRRGGGLSGSDMRQRCPERPDRALHRCVARAIDRYADRSACSNGLAVDLELVPVVIERRARLRLLGGRQ